MASVKEEENRGAQRNCGQEAHKMNNKHSNKDDVEAILSDAS